MVKSLKTIIVCFLKMYSNEFKRSRLGVICADPSGDGTASSACGPSLLFSRDFSKMIISLLPFKGRVFLSFTNDLDLEP